MTIVKGEAEKSDTTLVQPQHQLQQVRLPV
jgi:hypothetical protein